jgi:hypothetical protein
LGPLTLKGFPGDTLLMRLGSLITLVFKTLGGGPTMLVVLRLDSDDPNLTLDEFDKLVDRRCFDLFDEFLPRPLSPDKFSLRVMFMQGSIPRERRSFEMLLSGLSTVSIS